MKAAGHQRDDRLTGEQRLAVETRGMSVALSAGAGCGKTFVLTERYLAHFDPRDPQALQPDELGRLVAITFTERAAREMRDRIRGECYRRLRQASPDDSSYWLSLLRALDTARISTIHSFCAALLRGQAVEAGLDPGFSVLEQAQSDTLLAEVVADGVRGLVAARDPVAIDLAARFDLRAFGEMLQSLVRAATAAEFERWRRISPDEQVAIWDEFHSQVVVPAVAREIATSTAAQQVLEVLRQHVPSHPAMQARREAILERLSQITPEFVDAETLRGHLDSLHANARVQGGGTASSWPDKAAYERFKAAATELRELATDLRGVLAFDPQASREAAVVAGQVFAIADAVRLEYVRRKQELSALDFNDLLAKACQLLADPRHQAASQRMASQIHLLLVDEFQDTDPLQVALVLALCGGSLAAGKLFFVGDYKQSIYRFRGAKPGVFRELRQQTPEFGRQSLSLNFRSQGAILEFVNALFWDDLGEGYEPLRAHRPQVSPTPAVEFLWATGSGDAKENKDAIRRREARWIARRVRSILDGGEKIVWDDEAAATGKPEARSARRGDIAILFRALSDVQWYEEALREYGLDYYVVGGHAFYAQQEIFDLLNLLRAVQSAGDLLSLVGVLRSPMFSLADETIFWLSRHPEGISAGLFAADYPDEIPAEQRKQARFAADTLRILRERKDRVRVCELIDAALERTGYDAVLLGEFMGERKLANLRKLVEQSRSFERGDLFDLADFITQLSEFVVRQPDEALAATHSENTDVVRLMSIHQSKGLEFPIVFVPDVDRPRHHRAADVHFDPRLGPLVRLGGEDPWGGFELWRYAEREEEAAELHRLLYVATTRAADYLILSSGVSELGATGGPWTQLLARRFDLASGRFIGRLPKDEPIPQVKVTVAEPAVRVAPESRGPRVDLDKVIDRALREPGSADVSFPAIETIAPDLTARRQYSFSRLTGTLHATQPPPGEADAQELSAIDPRGLGTLVHAVLAAIDFGAPVDCQGLVLLHARRHGVDGAAEIGEATSMIEQFLASRRAGSLAASTESHAEIEFLLAWPPDDKQSSQIVTGFIDRLCRDAEGRWHVLDFKTNRVPAAGVSALATHFEMQMLVYALATERILGAMPASLTLHFLRTGEEHAFAWNDAEREKAIRLVAEGIVAAGALPTAVP